MTRCGKCAAQWAGHRIEHCTGCHATFTGTTSGDMHRVGEHGVDRRCLTDEEMLTKGMTQNPRGFWTTGREMPLTAFTSRSRSEAQA